LAGFGDLNAIALEKISISEGLQPGGVLIINGDCDLLVSTCRSKKIKFTTFGKTSSSDIKVEKISISSNSSRFCIDGTEVFLPLPGAGNVENAAAAWAVCGKFAITADDFADAVKNLPPISMRAQLMQIGNLTVLNDCYNANPASMKNALDILSQFGSSNSRRPVFICGDMAELGIQTEHFHAELGLAIANSNIKLLLTVGEFSKITADTAKSNVTHDLQIKSFKDTITACNELKEYVKDSDIVLVKGSRTVGLEKIIEKLEVVFS
jgi:UDP-N-acetylmuramoyl-tripeptide--D-alanyl-D-alanine ligase